MLYPCGSLELGLAATPPMRFSCLHLEFEGLHHSIQRFTQHASDPSSQLEMQVSRHSQLTVTASDCMLNLECSSGKYVAVHFSTAQMQIRSDV